MRKIVFRSYTGFCGMDGAEMHEYPDDVSEELLDREAWNVAVSNAASYGIYPSSDLEGISDEDYAELEESGEIDDYTDSIEGYWEDYDPEKHDGILY